MIGRGSAWFRRIAAVVSPLGRSLLIAVPVAYFFGYRLGLVELVAVAFAGTVLLLAAATHLVGSNASTVEITVARSRVVVGQVATGQILATNQTRHRLAGARVEVAIGSGFTEIGLPSLARGASSAHNLVLPTSHRGVFAIGPVRSVRADPIGLVRREIERAQATQLFVHPRTVGITSASSGLLRDLEGNATRELSSNDVSFHALREYLPGDERRNIHWKSSAKTGTHMVRQFEVTRRSHLVIALSLAAASFATADEFELAVSVAGSLGVRAIQDVNQVVVVVSAVTPQVAAGKEIALRSLNTRTRSRLLDDLSGLEQAESVLQITDLARLAAKEVSGISLAFLVCGSKTAAAELRAASNKFRLGVEVVAISCDPNTIPGMRRVTGLSVLTIGKLEDLQKSLARAAVL